MTEIGMYKATNVLLNRNGVLGKNHLLPKVYVVGDNVFVFFTAALRQQRTSYSLYGEKLPIEQVTIENAYKIRNDGNEMPDDVKDMVVWDFDTIGTYSNEDWYLWQTEQYRDIPSVSRIFNIDMNSL